MIVVFLLFIFYLKMNARSIILFIVTILKIKSKPLKYFNHFITKDSIYYLGFLIFSFVFIGGFFSTSDILNKYLNSNYFNGRKNISLNNDLIEKDIRELVSYFIFWKILISQSGFEVGCNKYLDIYNNSSFNSSSMFCFNKNLKDFVVLNSCDFVFIDLDKVLEMIFGLILKKKKISYQEVHKVFFLNIESFLVKDLNCFYFFTSDDLKQSAKGELDVLVKILLGKKVLKGRGRSLMLNSLVYSYKDFVNKLN